MEKPLVDGDYTLQKFPGKGGWTYAAIDLAPDTNAPFGWIKVRGLVDSFALSNYNLMPMGNGRLFLPVRAEIRKKIAKSAGDSVRVTLYADLEPLAVPEELRECLELEPEALAFFDALPANEQQSIADWIYSVKKDETRVQRIVQTLDDLVERARIASKVSF